MTDPKNPVGILGFDHIEYTAKDAAYINDIYKRFGFKHSAAKQNGQLQELWHKNSMKVLITQGGASGDYAFDYAEKHGDGVCTLAFWVKDLEHALNETLNRGAEQVEDITVYEDDNGLVKRAAVKGFGDVRNVFIERQGKAHFWKGFKDADDVDADDDVRLYYLDHLTNNVPMGEMDKWVDFYCNVYGMECVKYFHIQGKFTGLKSKVVRLADKSVMIPINEPTEGKSQIQEFLDLHNGPGVQHIAMTTKNIVDTISTLRGRGFDFLYVPDNYYEKVMDRVPNLKEDLEHLKSQSVLADGDDEGYLLQLFTETAVGPLFFEIIERKNHWGFGEGNFQALFDSMEEDQIRRGYLQPETEQA